MKISVHNFAHCLAAAVLIGAPIVSVAGSDGLPPSSLPGVKSVDTVERMVMPEVDIDSLLAEDAERERAGRPVPARYAKGLPVAFTPANSGTWEELSDGSRLWRLRIASPGALSLSLGLNRFNLPTGAAFWVHDPDGAWVQGPYSTENRNALGGLWTAVVLGDELVAELRLPAGAEANLEIDRVNFGYRFFGERETAAGVKRGRATSTSSARRVTRGATRSGRWRALPSPPAQARSCVPRSSSTTPPRTTRPIS